jgi:hypothetical protein
VNLCKGERRDLEGTRGGAQGITIGRGESERGAWDDFGGGAGFGRELG